MALSNAERQKRYRETRKEKVSELDMLRNELKQLSIRIHNAESNEHQIRHIYGGYLRNFRLYRSHCREIGNCPQISELRDRYPQEAKIEYPEFIDQENALFFVEEGKLQLLHWPETPVSVLDRGLTLATWRMVDKKYSKQCNKLIDDHNASLK